MTNTKTQIAPTNKSVVEFKQAIIEAIDKGELFARSNSTPPNSTLTIEVPIGMDNESMELGLEPTAQWDDTMDEAGNETLGASLEDSLLDSLMDSNEQSTENAEEAMLQSILLSHAEAFAQDGTVVSMSPILNVAYLLGYTKVEIDLVSLYNHQVKSLS